MSTKVFDTWVAVNEDASNSAKTNPTHHRLPNQPARGRGIATQVLPRFELLLPGEPIAVDIEFEDFSRNGEVYDDDYKNINQRGKPIWHSRIAWIGAVNTRCETVLDVFASYPLDSNIRTKIPQAPGRDFGVKKHLLWSDNGAVDAQTVEQWCHELFRNRPVVVHDGTSGLTAFQYGNPYQGASKVYDTQVQWAWAPELEEKYKRRPGLKILALTILKKVIQENGVHGPIEDADATMRLHLRKTPYDRETEAKKWKAVWKASQAQQVPQPSSYARSNTNYHSARGGQAVSGHRGVNLVSNNSGHGSQVMTVNGNVVNNYVEVQNFFPPLLATRGGRAAGNMGGRGGNAGRGGAQGRGGVQAAGRGGVQAAGRGGVQDAVPSYAQAAGRGGGQGVGRGGVQGAGRGTFQGAVRGGHQGGGRGGARGGLKQWQSH